MQKVNMQTKFLSRAFVYLYARAKLHGYMDLAVKKPVFEVSDKARLKPVSSATETS